MFFVYLQNIKAGQFQHFDFGEHENLIKYGQVSLALET